MSSCSENTTGAFDRFSLDPLSPQLLGVCSRSVVQKGLKGSLAAALGDIVPQTWEGPHFASAKLIFVSIFKA